jgi:hypothetical protein
MSGATAFAAASSAALAVLVGDVALEDELAASRGQYGVQARKAPVISAPSKTAGARSGDGRSGATFAGTSGDLAGVLDSF